MEPEVARKISEFEIAPDKVSAIQKLQFRWRASYRPLDRRMLYDRLCLEEKMWSEGYKLVAWLMVFLLFLLFSTVTANREQQLGVHNFLSHQFGLTEISDVRTSDEMWRLVAHISERSKTLLQSSQTFLRNDDYLRLIMKRRKFVRRVAVNTDFRLKNAFTISAWVKAPDGTVSSGNLLGKVLLTNRTRTCWAAGVDGRWHYGDHDAGLLENAPLTTFAAPPIEIAEGMEWRLVTFVYERNHALNTQRLRHYVNDIMVYDYALARPVTDCEGTILMGDRGLTLGSLTYIPQALGLAQIEELLKEGQVLQDLVSGQAPNLFDEPDGTMPVVKEDVVSKVTDNSAMLMLSLEERILRTESALAEMIQSLQRTVNKSLGLGSAHVGGDGDADADADGDGAGDPPRIGDGDAEGDGNTDGAGGSGADADGDGIANATFAGDGDADADADGDGAGNSTRIGDGDAEGDGNTDGAGGSGADADGDGITNATFAGDGDADADADGDGAGNSTRIGDGDAEGDGNTDGAGGSGADADGDGIANATFAGDGDADADADGDGAGNSTRIGDGDADGVGENHATSRNHAASGAIKNTKNTVASARRWTASKVSKFAMQAAAALAEGDGYQNGDADGDDDGDGDGEYEGDGQGAGDGDSSGEEGMVFFVAQLPLGLSEFGLTQHRYYSLAVAAAARLDVSQVTILNVMENVTGNTTAAASNTMAPKACVTVHTLLATRRIPRALTLSALNEKLADHTLPNAVLDQAPTLVPRSADFGGAVPAPAADDPPPSDPTVWPQAFVFPFAALHYSGGTNADGIARVPYVPLDPWHDVDVGAPQGFSVALWLKLQKQGTLLAKQTPDHALCWAWLVMEHGFRLELANGEIYTFPFASGYTLPRSGAYAFSHRVVLMGRGRRAAVYLDMALVAEHTLSVPWAAFEREGQVFIGARVMGEPSLLVKDTQFVQQPFDGYLWDVRVMPVALTDRQVELEAPRSALERRWADAPVPMVMCVDRITAYHDEGFKSELGLECSWYHERSKQGHYVCDGYVRFHCPLACQTIQPCYQAYLATAATTTVHADRWRNVWNRIHRFEDRAVLCTSQSWFDSRRRLYDACVAQKGLATQRRVQNDALTFNWTIFETLEEAFPDLRDYRRFSQDCEAILTQTQPDCTWPDGALSLMRTAPEFTMVFYTKGVRHIQGLTEASPGQGWTSHDPLFHIAATSGAQGMYLSGARAGPGRSCEAMERVGLISGGHKHSDKEWIMWAISKDSRESSSFFLYKHMNSDPWSVTGCLDKLPLEGLYFLGVPGMLVSQIQLRPGTLPMLTLQRLYYDNKAVFANYLGPRMSGQEQARPSPLDLAAYPYTIHSVAPPLATASIAGPAQCQGLSRSVREWRTSALTTACSAQSGACSQDWLDRSALVCVDPAARKPTHFGRNATEFLKQQVFVEFLYTLDNPLLVRAETLVGPTQFAGPEATSLELILVLYTQGVDMLSVTRVTFTLKGASVVPKWQLLHYPALRQDAFLGVLLPIGIAALGMLALLLVMTALDLWRWCRTTSSGARRATAPRGLPLQDSLSGLLYNAVVLSGTMVFLVLRCVYWASSYSHAMELLENIKAIPWADGGTDFKVKTQRYFTYIESIVEQVTIEHRLSAVTMFLMICMLVNIIRHMRAHPRLNLLPATLVAASNDLINFLISAGVIYLGTASLGWYMFSSYSNQFATFPRTLGTQAELLLGSFPEGWQEDAALCVWTVLFSSTIYYCLLNFLLAIIVEAYQKAHESTTQTGVTQNFILDLLGLIIAKSVRVPFRWPANPSLLRSLGHNARAHRKVTFNELLDSGVFPDSKSCVKWYQFYAKCYPFLKYKVSLSDFVPASPSRKGFKAFMKGSVQPTDVSSLKSRANLNPSPTRRPTTDRISASPSEKSVRLRFDSTTEDEFEGSQFTSFAGPAASPSLSSVKLLPRQDSQATFPYSDSFDSTAPANPRMLNASPPRQRPPRTKQQMLPWLQDEGFRQDSELSRRSTTTLIMSASDQPFEDLQRGLQMAMAALDDLQDAAKKQPPSSIDHSLHFQALSTQVACIQGQVAVLRSHGGLASLGATDTYPGLAPHEGPAPGQA